MKIIIEGDPKEIAELLATIRQNEKPVTLAQIGDLAKVYRNQTDVRVSTLDLPVVVSLSVAEAVSSF